MTPEGFEPSTFGYELAELSEHYFQSALIREGKVHLKYSADKHDYLMDKYQREMAFQDLKKQHKNDFPYLEYFTRYRSSTSGPDLYDYNTQCFIKPGHSIYQEILYIGMMLCPPNRLKAMLEYQYQIALYEKSTYYAFLNSLDELLYESHLKLNQERASIIKEVRNDFDLRELKQSNHQDSTEETAKHQSLRRKVLSIYYLMGGQTWFNKTDKTKAAEFIQFITGKELGASKVSDTNIYKLLINPLSRSNEQVLKDLQFVRERMELIGATEAVARINKEISNNQD